MSQVLLQGMRSVSGAFGRPVGVQYTYKRVSQVLLVVL